MWWRKDGHFGAGKRKRELSRGGEKVCGWPKLWNDRGDGGRRRRRQAPGLKSESDGQTEKKEECSGVRRDHKKDRMSGRFGVERTLQFLTSAGVNAH